MLVPLESSSAVLVMIRSKSVSICNCSRARLVDSSRNCTFSRGYPNLMHSYGGLLEPRGSKLALLKSMFNAENFICRLSRSISSDFDAVHSWNVCGSHKSQKKSLKTPILGFMLVQGHQCWYQKLGTLGYHMVKTWSRYLTWAWFGTGSWRTDGRTEFPWLIRALSSTCRYSCRA